MKAPEARREVLILLAGILWSAVGAALVAVALGWLNPIRPDRAIPVALGLSAAAAIHRFGFSRLAAVNLDRIRAQSPGKAKVCLFAFQNWRSYVMIAAMMTLGYALRHSPFPKIYLAPVYLGIGLALILSSVNYYRSLR